MVSRHDAEAPQVMSQLVAVAQSTCPLQDLLPHLTAQGPVPQATFFWQALLLLQVTEVLEEEEASTLPLQELFPHETEHLPLPQKKSPVQEPLL